MNWLYRLPAWLPSTNVGANVPGSLRQHLQQHASDVLAHHQTNVVFRNSLLQQRFGNQRHTAGVERLGHGSIEVGTEPNVLSTHHANRVADSLGDRCGIGAAGSYVPVAHTDNTSGRSNRAQLLVTQVAAVVAHAFHASVGNDYWHGRDRGDLTQGIG